MNIKFEVIPYGGWVDYTVWNYADIDMCERPFEIRYLKDGNCCVNDM